MKYVLGKELYIKYMKFSATEKILMWVCVGYLLCWFINRFDLLI